MISRLTGNLVALIDGRATLEIGGVCYEVLVPSGLIDNLKESLNKDEKITLHTIYYIEAGDMRSSHYPRMVGFTDTIDKDFFQKFIGVPGLGVKKALKSLIIPVKQIATYIENKDASGLSSLPGVGARLAEKIIAELSGKTAKFALAQSETPLAVVRREKNDFTEEALDALLQLQYNRREAEDMIAAALERNPRIKSTEELISLVFSGSKVEA